MFRISIASLLICFAFIFHYCTDKNEPIGKWDDCIKLSTKSIEFGAEADSAMVTTKGDGWWINSITLDNETYFSVEKIDPTPENYTIKRGCFTIQHQNKNALFVKMEENENHEERVVTITLQYGNFFDHLTITQQGR